MQVSSIRNLSFVLGIYAPSRTAGNVPSARASRWRILLLLATTLLLAIGLASENACAQTAHLSAYLTPVGPGNGTGVYFWPGGAAVDGQGNVYITDDYLNQVVMDTPLGNGYTQTILPFTGLNQPAGVAVDLNGNVYVADTGNTRVVMLTLAGGVYTQSTIAQLPSSGAPSGVAVDSMGNVYFTDTSSGAVTEETLVGGVYISSVITEGELEGPIAVDSAGNVYVSGHIGGYAFGVVVLAPGPSGYTLSPFYLDAHAQAFAGLAVDSSNNVYFSYYQCCEKYPQVIEVSGGVASDAAYTGIYGPAGIAVDASGNLYIVDTGAKIGNYVTPVIKQSAAGGVFQASDTSGFPQFATGAIFTFDTAGTLGSTAVLTQGATEVPVQGTLYTEFGNTGEGPGVLCTAGNAYNAGDSCVVWATDYARNPGTQYGAIELLDASSNVLATAPIEGTNSVGSQVNFFPGTQTKIGSGFSLPAGVAVDASGNAYVADAGLGQVVLEAPSGGSYSQSVLPFWELSSPVSVAIDGAGNLYIVDSLNGALYKESLSAGSYTSSTIASGLNQPSGVAVDGEGDVFVSDTFNHQVLEWVPVQGGYSASSVVGSGMAYPRGVAVDGSGDVYVADNVNNKVYLETLTATGYQQSTIGSDLTSPEGVAVDAVGNVFITEAGIPGAVLKETLTATGYIQNTGAITGESVQLVDPAGIAVDGNGNLYITSGDAPWVMKEDYSDAPSLTFAGTPVGFSSSPATQTVENVGNYPLMFGNYYGPNSVFSLNNGEASACPITTYGATLAAGAWCQLQIGFTPTQSGAFTGSLGIYDSNLNAKPSGYALQTINFSGTGTADSPTITSVSPIASQKSQIITIAGSGFGAQAASTGDSTYIELVDDSGTPWAAGHSGNNVTLAVTSWTDSQIVLSGFSGTYGPVHCIRPGDQLSVSVWNAQTGEGPAVYSLVASGGTDNCPTKISTISPILPQQTQTITITGEGFGTQAAYTGDSNYITLADVSGAPWFAGQTGNTVTLAVSSWTNTQIVLTGLSGTYGAVHCIRPGDQLSVSVWNAQTGNGPAVYPILASAGINNCPAKITSISAVLPQKTQTITITGEGFGTHAAYTGDSNYIQVTDSTRSWNAGYGTNGVTLVVSSWTDYQIVLGGFSGSFGPNHCIAPGDHLSFSVWNVESGVSPVVYPVVATSGSSTCP